MPTHLDTLRLSAVDPDLSREAGMDGNYGHLDTAAPVVPVFLAVYIATTNDTNGGPRRGWYVSRFDHSAPRQWIEGGYGNFPWAGFATALALPVIPGEDWYDTERRVRPYVYVTGRINVPPGEYRAARKLPRFGGAS